MCQQKHVEPSEEKCIFTYIVGDYNNKYDKKRCHLGSQAVK